MVSSVHFLLTYTCNYECDHCFLYCGPHAQGVFTLAQLEQTFAQIERAGDITSVYFEGGEATLYFPLLVEAVRMATSQGLRAGLVTNSYFATTERDAGLWLKPLVDAGLKDLTVSDDVFHNPESGPSPASLARAAAQSLGMAPGTICLEPPGQDRAVMVRGRAVEKLAADVPRHQASGFGECPHEELRAPDRIHLDPFGHVHICQGLLMGNIWQKPFKELFGSYNPESHPVVGPLLRGGPYALACDNDLPLDERGYVDACHLCFEARRALQSRMPQLLAPELVYGM